VDKGVLSSFPTTALTVVDFRDADLGFATFESPGAKVEAGRLRLTAAESPASATFNNVQCEGVRLPAGSRVTFAWRDGVLHLTADELPLSMSFSTTPRLTMACERCSIAGSGQASARLADSTLHTLTYASSQIATVGSDAPGMGLTLDAAVGSVPMEGNFILDRVDFTGVDDSGRVRVSSILSGELEYTGLGRPVRQLRGGEFVVPALLEDFYLTRVVVGEEGLSLEMHGRAGELNVGGAGNIEDALPSGLEEVMGRWSWALYAAAAVAAGILAAGMFGPGQRRTRG
jgi:hypothetical protein